ncbi:MAG: prolyl oligopeptidase family serine peptidase [Gemmatimonadota bacterium]|nr:prolyl oligopeptidase family serine peptidase [Gemmatimonadota bacterium]
MKPVRTLIATLAAMAALAAPSSAQEPDDPYRWLEDVEGERALEWVRERSEATFEELSAHPAYEEIRERALEILESDERIAYPRMRGGMLYNFWKDEENPRGVWRRTSWDSFLSDETDWEVVLDIDALSEVEEVNWAFGGATCLPPEDTLCMVRLSRGGSDATEVREFDAAAKRFVEDGFFLPEAKQGVAWEDENTLLVATDFGEGSLTTSGYPRIVKRWRRGTPLSAAGTVFEGERTDVSVGAWSLETPERIWHIVYHSPRFFERELFVLEGDGLTKIDVPLDSSPRILGEHLVVYLRSPWEVGGATYPAGSLVAIDFEAFRDGARDFEVVVEPGERQTIEGWSATRNRLLVSLLDEVRTRLLSFRREGGEWMADTIPAPELGSVDIRATSQMEERWFFTSSGYTRPTTLYLAEADGEIREVRRLPEMFDAEGLVVEQHHATSRDGTRVPYFVVRGEDVELDGTDPTLLYGYGGFEISLTPSYSGVVGASWLERGGVFVVANIRGGGEFGPSWHRTAQKEHRQRAYDDFLAVAEDLVDRGITSPDHLGIRGGSNGGLLVGVAMTQRPDLFDAVVAEVPLMDMRRYHELLAGASWMAEYGDPGDPEQWAYIREYSPYHNVEEDADYPKAFLYTTTRDDRVHPGHARKMAARLEELGHPVYFFENTEGGHGRAVTAEQRARMYALEYAYLWKRLAGEEGTR